jgi:hypothetical protein
MLQFFCTSQVIHVTYEHLSHRLKPLNDRLKDLHMLNKCAPHPHPVDIHSLCAEFVLLSKEFAFQMKAV